MYLSSINFHWASKQGKHHDKDNYVSYGSSWNKKKVNRQTERTDADKVSNRPVTTFSIASSPIIHRTKALVYMTILTWKFQATHPPLTDFKKRQKLHWCTKNLENNFSFPGIFVSNIAMNPFSSSYHLIQLSNYYKNMSFSKMINTGHCANHRENQSKLLMFYIYSHVFPTFDWENWNDPFFWFPPVNRTFQVLQKYVIFEDDKYCLLCQRWRKLFKTLLCALLIIDLNITLGHLSMHLPREIL